MGWPFCPNCRATLKVDSTGAIDCDVCGYKSNLSEIEALPSITTYSMKRPTPIWAKSDEEQEALRRSNEPVRATIEEPCIRCGHPEILYCSAPFRRRRTNCFLRMPKLQAYLEYQQLSSYRVVIIWATYTNEMPAQYFLLSEAKNTINSNNNLT